MKQKIYFLFLSVIIFLCACNNSQNDAKTLASQIESTAKANTPGFIATSENGYYMKARIDGHEWVAKAMLPNDNSDSRRIQGENNGESIGFYLWMRGLENDKKINFSESNAVDLFTNDDVGIWGGRKGEIEITKIDDNVLEGNFHFTASTGSSNKTLEVTDGFFRLPLTNAQK
jgi:hypothetical protein